MLFFCTALLAADVCEPTYPDQVPFDGCANGKWVLNPSRYGESPGIVGEYVQYVGAQVISGNSKYIQAYINGSVSGGGVGTCDQIRIQFQEMACKAYNPNAPKRVLLPYPSNPLCPEKMYIHWDTLAPINGGCSGGIGFRYPSKSEPAHGVFVETVVYTWKCK